MRPQILLPTIAAFACLELAALFAYISARTSRRPEHGSFAFFCFCMAAMVWSTLLLQEIRDIRHAVPYLQLQFVSVYLGMAALVHFTLVVTHYGALTAHRRTAAIYLGNLGLSSLAFLPAVFHAPPPGVAVAAFHECNDMAMGRLFAPYAVVPFAEAVLCVVLMTLRHRRERNHPRTGHEDALDSGSLYPWLPWIAWGVAGIIGAGALEMAELYPVPFHGIEWFMNPRACAATLFVVLMAGVLLSEMKQTQRRQHALREANDRLHSLCDSRLQTIREMQHQVKNKLVGVQWPLRNVLRALDRDAPSSPQCARLGRVLADVDELFDMLDLMLNVARLQAGQTVVAAQRRQVDLPEMVHSILHVRALQEQEEIAARLGTPNQPLRRIRVDCDLPDGRLELPEMLVRQILVNLVDNAFKYSSAETSIEAWLGPDEAGVGLRITDHGCGISEEDRLRIFTEPFYRADHCAGTAGIGIGLSLANRYLEAIGGRIWVESEGPGKGSTFCVVLPES